jgi:transposase
LYKILREKNLLEWEYENPLMYQSRESSRTGRDRSWIALIECLYPASKSDPPRFQPRAAPKEIARNLGCATQTVRNAVHAFQQRGLHCLKQESSRPKTVQAQFDQAKCEALRALLHQSPRAFGKATSLWTLELAAEVSFEQGLTASQVSIETIRLALKRLGVGWQRAKHWITSPDPAYAKKKKRRNELISLAQRNGWEVGYMDARLVEQSQPA